MEGLIYYQSTYPKFRYGDGKELGTQPHPTSGSAFTHCVLHFNLIKGTFNIYHSKLINTLAYIQQTTWHFSSQNLAYIYHASHHIISKSETQTWQYSNKCYRHLNIKNTSFNHAYSCECMTCFTYLIAPWHLCINA